MTRAGTTVGISGYVRAGAGAGGGAGGVGGGFGSRAAVSAAAARGYAENDAAGEDGHGGVDGGGGGEGKDQPRRGSSAAPGTRYHGDFTAGGGGGGGGGEGRPVSAPIRGPTSFRREPEPNIPVEQKKTMKPPRVSSGRATAANGGAVPVLAEANMAQATVRATHGPHRPPSGRAQFRLSTGGLRY